MKIWVTGGAGFIGSHLVERLIKDGHEVVYVVDHHKRDKKRWIPDEAEVLKEDFASEEVFNQMQKDTPDVIFHLAAKISASESVRRPEHYTDENVRKTVGLLHAAKEAGVKKFFAMSSAAVYGNHETEVTEESETRPLNPYGITKLNIESHLDYYNRVHGMQTVAIRLANIYGPRQNAASAYSGVISIFMRQILNGETPTIFGDGEVVRDFIYVDDFIDFLTLLPGSDISGIYNVSSNTQTTIRQLWDTLKNVSGTDLEVEHKEDRPGDIRISIINSSKVSNALGWKAKTSLEEGLKKTLEWFKEHGL